MDKAKLASQMCIQEGKKSQIKRGDMLEAITVQENFFAERIFQGDRDPWDAHVQRVQKQILRLEHRKQKESERAARAQLKAMVQSEKRNG
jgi:hypothetical protein